MKNILEYFEKTAETYPDKVGFTDSEREATFAEVKLRARAIGSFLAEHGSRRPVAILIDKKVNCMDTMLGALYAGDFYVVVDVHSPADRIENILRVLDDLLVVTDEQSEELAKSLNVDYFLYEEISRT